ncbi:hypothetical protein NU219Hw_g5879t1 [Hortaea werneckii]
MCRTVLTGASPRIHHHHVKTLRRVTTALPPIHHYTTTTTTSPSPNPPPPSLRPHQVLSYRYEPHPHPINCTTLPPTKDYLADPSHPHHLKAKRKLHAFNPTILNWRVHCPVAASGKKVVRDWCSRRARTALQQTLQQRLQLNLDGSLQEEDGGRGGKSSSPSPSSPSQSAGGSERAPPRQGLKGALLVILKTETALTASTEEVRQAVGWVLESVRREDRAREFGGVGGKVGKKGDARGEKRLVKGGGKGLRSEGGKEV